MGILNVSAPSCHWCSLSVLLMLYVLLVGHSCPSPGAACYDFSHFLLLSVSPGDKSINFQGRQPCIGGGGELHCLGLVYSALWSGVVPLSLGGAGPLLQADDDTGPLTPIMGARPARSPPPGRK